MEHIADPSNPLRDFFTSNPLATIWYKPRITFRELINTSPEKYVIAFAVLSGIYRTLNQAIKRGFSEQFSLPWLFVVVILGGAVLGIISLYITGIALHFMGMMLGGEGKPEHIRLVIAWSSIPDGLLLLLAIPVVLLTGSDAIISNPETREMILFAYSLIMLLPVTVVFFILRTIIFVAGLTEVNEFPVWKTLITVAGGYIVMFIPFLCLIGLLSF